MDLAEKQHQRRMAVNRPESHGRRAREYRDLRERALRVRPAVEASVDVEDARALAGDVIDVPGVERSFDQRLPIQTRPQGRNGYHDQQRSDEEGGRAQPV